MIGGNARMQRKDILDRTLKSGPQAWGVLKHTVIYTRDRQKDNHCGDVSAINLEWRSAELERGVAERTNDYVGCEIVQDVILGIGTCGPPAAREADLGLLTGEMLIGHKSSNFFPARIDETHVPL